MTALTTRCWVPDSRVPLILAENVFIVVDDGVAVAADYPILERIVITEGRKFQEGIAGLIIVPKGSRPPRDEIRQAIRETLGNVSKHIRSMCWYVEGTGFQAAAVRAVMSGLVMLLDPPYPAHITTNLRDALAWSYGRLGGSGGRDLDSITQQIAELRISVDRKLMSNR